MSECGVRSLSYAGIKLMNLFITLTHFMYLYIISYILKLSSNDVAYPVPEVFQNKTKKLRKFKLVNRDQHRHSTNIGKTIVRSPNHLYHFFK